MQLLCNYIQAAKRAEQLLSPGIPVDFRTAAITIYLGNAMCRFSTSGSSPAALLCDGTVLPTVGTVVQKLNSRSEVGFAFGRFTESTDFVRSGLAECAQARLPRMLRAGSGPSSDRHGDGAYARPVHLYAIPRRGGIAFVTNNMLGRLCGTVFQFETRLPAESSHNIPDMFRGFSRVWTIGAIGTLILRYMRPEACSLRRSSRPAKLSCLSLGETKICRPYTNISLSNVPIAPIEPIRES